jgi:hypothetical protein
MDPTHISSRASRITACLSVRESKERSCTGQSWQETASREEFDFIYSYMDYELGLFYIFGNIAVFCFHLVGSGTLGRSGRVVDSSREDMQYKERIRG